MSVEDLDVVDIISTNTSGHVVLSISDHLDWADSTDHQLKLQAKLNKYLAFIENGEIFDRYPEAKGRSVTIRVVFKFAPDPGGEEFLERASRVVEQAGFTLRRENFAASSDG